MTILNFHEQQELLAATLEKCDRTYAPSEAHWEESRRRLRIILKKFAEEYFYKTDTGDFIVGDDWFETNCLRVVDLNWKLISCPLIEAVQDFLKKSEGRYVVTIARSFPRELHGLEIMITTTGVFTSIYGKRINEITRILKEKTFDFLLQKS